MTENAEPLLAMSIALLPGLVFLTLRWRGNLGVPLLIALAVLPVVPNPRDPRALAFLLLATAAFLVSGGSVPRAIRPFLFVITMAIAWSPSFGSWGRGAVPFYFLLTAPIWKRVSEKRIFAALIISGSLLASRGVFAFVQTRARITYTSLDFILPIPIIGLLGCIVLLIYEPWPLRRWRPIVIGCLVLQSTHVITTATFGYIAATALGIVTLLLPLAAHRKSLKRLLVLAIALSGVAVLSGPVIIQPFVERTKLGAIEVSTAGRIEEAQAAIAEWTHNPLIGRGLGHSFRSPVSGTDLEVTYVHNVVSYLLMTLGVLGLVAYLYLIAWIRASAKGSNWLPTFVRAALLALLALSLTSAVFRSIQFNCLLALMVGLASRCSRRRTLTAERTAFSIGIMPHASTTAGRPEASRARS